MWIFKKKKLNYFKSTVFIWYISEITEMEKFIVKYGNSIDKWADFLNKKWKDKPNVAMQQ